MCAIIWCVLHVVLLSPAPNNGYVLLTYIFVSIALQFLILCCISDRTECFVAHRNLHSIFASNEEICWLLFPDNCLAVPTLTGKLPFKPDVFHNCDPRTHGDQQPCNVCENSCSDDWWDMPQTCKAEGGKLGRWVLSSAVLTFINGHGKLFQMRDGIYCKSVDYTEIFVSCRHELCCLWSTFLGIRKPSLIGFV